MNVIIRNYSDADRDACLDAFKSNIPTYFLQSELNDFNNWLSVEVNSIHKPEEVWRYYVIELDGLIIGCGGFVIEQVKNEARMTWGMIHRTAHRKGLGKQLLLWRMDQIRSIDPTCKIALDTTQHAAPFFEKIGFKTWKITVDSYGPGMHRFDMLYDPAPINELN